MAVLTITVSKEIMMMKHLSRKIQCRIRHGSEPVHEDGFEIAQSMGIALLGLVVAAAFATALDALGADIIDQIRSELGL